MENRPLRRPIFVLTRKLYLLGDGLLGRMTAPSLASSLLRFFGIARHFPQPAGLLRQNLHGSSSFLFNDLIAELPFLTPPAFGELDQPLVQNVHKNIINVQFA